MSAILKVVEKEGMENKNKALDAALAQIERAFGKGSIMKLGQREALEIEVDLDRLAGPRHRARHRRPAQGPHRRDLRPGKLGQDDAGPARRRRGPEEGRRLRLRRRRACARSGLRQASSASTSTTC